MFTPENSEAVKVPYFEDVSRDAGWQGFSTTKSQKKLQAEIGESITRLGGFVSGFQKGTFILETQQREGFQVHYSIKSPSGQLIPGRVDIAALPVKDKWNSSKKEKSLCMALYMLRNALDGMWFMQQLSPGYAPLMPWMLTPTGKTVSQMWSESSIMSHLLPSGESEFIDAEVTNS